MERNEWLIQATKWSNLGKAAQSDRSHKGDSVRFCLTKCPEEVCLQSHKGDWSLPGIRARREWPVSAYVSGGGLLGGDENILKLHEW